MNARPWWWSFMPSLYLAQSVFCLWMMFDLFIVHESGLGWGFGGLSLLAGMRSTAWSLFLLRETERRLS